MAYTQIHCTGIYHFSIVPSILKACAYFSLIHNGKALHAESMADMYPNSGDTFCLSNMFEEMLERNALTWNAMIGGYSAWEYKSDIGFV